MPAFIRQVTIRNYKSIANCQVKLGALTFLLGLNGAGKSNFLDALRFVAEALRTSLDHALRDRGGIGEIRLQSGNSNTMPISIRIEFTLDDGRKGHYSVSLQGRHLIVLGDELPYVEHEECFVYSISKEKEHDYFIVKNGTVNSNINNPPAVQDSGLYLISVSGSSQFRPVFNFLTRIDVYDIKSPAISSISYKSNIMRLQRDGGNAASIFRSMPDDIKKKLTESMIKININLISIEVSEFMRQEQLVFFQIIHGNDWDSHDEQPAMGKFPASAMSDGTLRALGVLLAVYQTLDPPPGVAAPLLIGLEEPESGLHPAAAKVLLSALRRGAAHCQLIATSHSPDLLDDPDIDADELLAVDNIDGVTRIGPIDEAGRNALKERLFTPGELLRQNQIAIDKKSLENPDRQYKLFDHGER